MERAISVFESQNKTGNSVLDTVLTGKSLQCGEYNINFTCVADGTLLDFMEALDICSIFGNALDNAIESVKELADSEKRLIRLAVFSQNDFLMLRIENYYEGNLQFEDDLPLTTKKDKQMHGYGLKSIRSAAEKYGGTMSIKTDDNWFTINVLIPMGH
jgi:sensor histidine kinase regulating citrate/malate metabolism